MALKQITYFVDGKKKTIKVKKVHILSFGLMFRKNSPPLLFKIPKTMDAAITSIFCKPFKAIWLDDKMHATKVLEVKKWKFRIVGKGRYLLEIPLSSAK